MKEQLLKWIENNTREEFVANGSWHYKEKILNPDSLVSFIESLSVEPKAESVEGDKFLSSSIYHLGIAAEKMHHFYKEFCSDYSMTSCEVYESLLRIHGNYMTELMARDIALTKEQVKDTVSDWVSVSDEGDLPSHDKPVEVFTMNAYEDGVCIEDCIDTDYVDCCVETGRRSFANEEWLDKSTHRTHWREITPPTK